VAFVQMAEQVDGLDAQRGVTLVLLCLKTVTVPHNLLVLVVTGIISYKAHQEHYTNHNTAGMINIIKRVLVTAHTRHRVAQVWMDVE
jgi:hypothetical protein